MKCLDCPLKYIGQTGRMFKIEFKEHIQAIRNNNSNSGYRNNILSTETMDVIRTRREDRHLNTLERYHIYRISRNNVHMNVVRNKTYNTQTLQ
jgi:hypothetical protein